MKVVDNTPAFLAIPNCEGDQCQAVSSGAQVANPALRIVLHESVRKRLQQQRGLGRF
jgi:hypothetical protein